MLSCCVLLSACSRVKNPPGRDTIDTFGDGRYEILRSGTQGRIMYDSQTQTTISRDVIAWKRKGTLVYAISSDPERFILVDYTSGIVRKHERLEDVPLPEREVLERIEDRKR